MIYVARGGQKQGPYSEKETRDKLDAGELKLTDLAWHEGLPNWIGLSDLLGIAIPPIPATSAALSTASTAPGTTIGQTLRGHRTITDKVVVPGIGMIGALLAIIVSFGCYLLKNEFIMRMLGWWAPEQAHSFSEGAFLLFLFGLIGGALAVLWYRRGHNKIVAVGLIICGIAPMFYAAIALPGLPMSLAGFIGLFVKGRKTIPATALPA
jgi:hypothetical protein